MDLIELSKWKCTDIVAAVHTYFLLYVNVYSYFSKRELTALWQDCFRKSVEMGVMADGKVRE